MKNIQTKAIPLHSKDVYWGKVPKETLEDALRIIDTQGWDAFDKKFKGLFDFTYDESRADWRFLVPLKSDWTVLDAGAGMGRITIPLARVVKKVVAFDQSLLRMEFLKRRVAKEGLHNVEIFVGDIFDLPLAEGSFDLVSLNGVLEWVGKTDRYKNPRDAQVVCLKICKKLLKPGGFLYIGIENRAALVYLRTHDHGGLRYTSYLPRFLANIYVKLRQGQEYRTYTYTKSGYEKLLVQAGFRTSEFYLPYPGYNLPRIIMPYHNTNALAYLIRVLMPANARVRRVMKKLATIKLLVSLYRYFFFSFNIIVKND